jgi:hypothetical protein
MPLGAHGGGRTDTGERTLGTDARDTPNCG